MQPTRSWSVQPEGANSWNGRDVAVRESHDGKIRARLHRSRTTSVARDSIELRLCRIRQHERVLAVRRELRRRNRVALRFVFTAATSARTQSTRHVVRASEITTRDVVLRRSACRADDELSVTDQRRERIRGPFAVVRELRAADRFPAIPIGLRQNLLRREERDGGEQREGEARSSAAKKRHT